MDFELRKTHCKHSYTVEYTLERESSTTTTTDGDTATTTVTETVKVTKRVTYKQDGTAYNTAQTNEKHLFQSLLSERCNPIAEPPVAQTNEALCKILCHNLCCLIQSMFGFGVEPNFTTM